MKRRGAPPYPRALRGDRLTVAKPRRSSREFRWGENAHPYHRIVPDWSGFLTPWGALGASPWRREESCRDTRLSAEATGFRGAALSDGRVEAADHGPLTGGALVVAGLRVATRG